MNDPVSSELERRAHLDLPWRWAVAGALALHLTLAAALLAPSPQRRRALTLPSVQVRIIAAPPGRTARPATPAAPPAPKLAQPRRPKPVPQKAPKAPARHAAERSAPAPAVKASAPKPEPAAAAAANGGAQGSASPSAVVSPSGGIGLGPPATGDEAFPFSYYLNRVLALVEANWFRPPAAAGTTCQVRCVIDRSGRIAEAGLETSSASGAFDRAALRAVYAAAPFPPLPDGFSGNELTLHLEFGP